MDQRQVNAKTHIESIRTEFLGGRTPGQARVGLMAAALSHSLELYDTMPAIPSSELTVVLCTAYLTKSTTSNRTFWAKYFRTSTTPNMSMRVSVRPSRVSNSRSLPGTFRRGPTRTASSQAMWSQFVIFTTARRRATCTEPERTVLVSNLSSKWLIR